MIDELIEVYDRKLVVNLIRKTISEHRKEVKTGGEIPSAKEVATTVAESARSEWHLSPQSVFNATGVILHTNLGRAPLSPEASKAAFEAAQGYTDLELNISTGKRGSRQSHIGSLLSHLTNCESALAVNNNASAVLLALAAIADGKEVIVSRGEAVEIGGGFRIPDIMSRSGAKLMEVGTTNRTYIADYKNAITENTAVILKVHSSNFRVSGFTHTASIEELVTLGQRHGIPVIHDIGSGCLLDTEQFGLEHEPKPQDSIRLGCELVLFSGDKLLGGPQSGIVIGSKRLVEKLADHPLHRSMRIDKLSLSALVATLLHYIKGEETKVLPIWRMIGTSLEELRQRAHRWQKYIGELASVVEGESTIGGGSLPGEILPTFLVALNALGVTNSENELATKLRETSPPIIGRVEKGVVLLDPRTILPEEENLLLPLIKKALI
jgi:L-seryl-tRNA(Ser) seleniumtransferase